MRVVMTTVAGSVTRLINEEAWSYQSVFRPPRPMADTNNAITLIKERSSRNKYVAVGAVCRIAGPAASRGGVSRRSPRMVSKLRTT